MRTAIFSIALLGLLLLLLSFLVTYLRVKAKSGFGMGEDATSALAKAVRAHGNFCEYSGLMAVIILALGLTHPSFWMEWAMISFVFARMISAIGFLTTPDLRQTHLPKTIGMALTYLSALALSIGLLITAFSYTHFLVS